MAWILWAVVLLLLAALLLCRIHAAVTYDGGFHVQFRFLFITIRMKSAAEGKAKREPKEKEAEKPGKKTDVSLFLRHFSELLEWVQKAAGSALRRIRIDRLKIRLIIWEEDAAKTAIRFGEACAAVYTAVGFLSGVVKVRKHEIAIQPDYTDPAAACVEFSCSASVRAASALAFLVVQAVSLFMTLFRMNYFKKQPAKDGALK